MNITILVGSAFAISYVRNPQLYLSRHFKGVQGSSHCTCKYYIQTCSGQFTKPETTFRNSAKLLFFPNTTEIISVISGAIFPEKNKITVKLGV